MRVLLIAFIAATAACGSRGGGPQIQNLPLQWRGVERLPVASRSVARAFEGMPIAFALRDLRPEPTAVAQYEKTGFVVRTTDNVGQYCTDRLADLLARAGAHINQGLAGASVEAELLEYKAVAAGTDQGTARLRIVVRRGGGGGGGGESWSKTYEGTSRRRVRTHNADSFNDALSNALQDATSKLVADDDFARALMAMPPAPLQQPGPPRRPGSSSSSSSGG